jgi:hypothetical protein
MAQEKVKASALPSAGYQYQTLQGVKLLCEWLAAPGRYKKFHFECDHDEIAPRGLDDIVGLRADDRFDYWQVKFTGDPTAHKLSWEWLTEKGGKGSKSKSNIRKWFDALKQIRPDLLGDAQLVTNRIPDRNLEACLRGGTFIDYTVAPAVIREFIESELDTPANAEWFFGKLQILHSDKSYLTLENGVTAALLRFTDRTGAETLKNRAREWAIFEREPRPDGWITLEIIHSILSTTRPKPIPQDFSVPDGYLIPDQAFHSALMADIKSRTSPILPIVGPPGRGKSTYLSFLCDELRAKKFPVIRHHYFLSVDDATRDRLSSYVVIDSLLQQLDRLNAGFSVATQGSTDPAEILREALATCAGRFKKKRKRLVVVVDGLDHVWRDNAQDKRPLDDLFSLLIPVPDNVVLLIGTQPVDESQLPNRLVTHASKQSWRELPAMSADAIHSYLSSQLQARRLYMQHEGHPPGSELASCARNLRDLTNGHPLHVIYATQELIHLGRGLSTWTIEQLPKQLGEDARSYYASLWSRLPGSERDALILICEFEFYWPRQGIVEACRIGGQERVNAGAIEHLLYIGQAGLRPFHESLIVFVKSSAEYVDRIQVLAPAVERWLQESAPRFLRNTWLWSVQARLGKPENLIAELRRDWVLDRLVAGYSTNVPIKLLAQAEEIAFEGHQYADAIRLRHLKTRLLNGPDFQLGDSVRLRVCSWKLISDQSVVDEVVSSIHQLSTNELAGLARALRWRGDSLPAIECGKAALDRHRGERRLAARSDSQAEEKEIIALGRAFAEIGMLGSEQAVKSPALNSGAFDALEAYVQGLSVSDDLVQMVKLGTLLQDHSRRGFIQGIVIRHAALMGAEIHRWNEFNSFAENTVAACWGCLTTTFLPVPTTSIDADWLSSFYVSERRSALMRLAHEWFFKTALTALIADGEFSWAPWSEVGKHPELTEYFNALTSCAKLAAENWRAGRPFDFSEVFAQFADVQKPSQRDYEKYQLFVAFSAALIEIATDCHLLSTAVGGPAKVDFATFSRTNTSAWFNSNVFLSWYVERFFRFLDDAVATDILQSHTNRLASQITETKERAQDLLELTELALLHRSMKTAEQLCRLCWDYVLGYDSHKDPTILWVLDAIRHVADRAPDKARAMLRSVAPHVHYISDYTDGDETRYASEYADQILAKLDRHALVAKFESHIRSGEWRSADESLERIFEVANLRSPLVVAMARTGLPRAVVSVVERRANAGDDGAAEVLEQAREFAPLQSSDERTHEESETKDLPMFAGEPKDYPPAKVNALLGDIRKSQTFGAYAYLPRWYAYWEGEGRASELLQVLKPLLLSEDSRQGDLHYTLDQAFASSVKLEGKSAAFPLAVQAQRELGGWLDFFERQEKSYERLKRVARLYPERADDFISRSCFSWLRPRRETGSRVIPSEKLVYLLTQLDRMDEACAITETMVQGLHEDTRNLELTVPIWANDLEQTA